MIADAHQPPRLLLATSACPLEVTAVAVVAARESSSVFTADVREVASGPHHVDLEVTAPLAHDPSVRLHLSWAPGADGLVVSLDAEVVGAPGCGDRVRRTQLAVDRFAELLGSRLAG